MRDALALPDERTRQDFDVVTERLLDAAAAAVLVGRRPGTIRAWASTGLLTRRGKDRRGRTLYALDDVLAVADATRRRDTP